MKFVKTVFPVLLIHGVAASPLGPREATASVKSAAAPSSTEAAPYSFASGVVTSYPIHDSCNITLRRQLERALDETIQLARHAKQHLLFQGHDSPFTKKYFGNSSSTGTAQAIGWYERVESANKVDMLFRCDDPDRNCETQDGELTLFPSRWPAPNVCF